MISFTTTILKFGSMGEKSGWTYIIIPADLALKLIPGNKKTFRVKGKLDNQSINGVALFPSGNGDFIMPLNVIIRKKIGKQHGASVEVQITVDKAVFKVNADLMNCLNDDPDALTHFNKLAISHQRYFSNWVDSAKTEVTKAKRIALSLKALANGLNYGEMLQNQKKQ